MDLKLSAIIVLLSSLLSGCLSATSHKSSTDFESCLGNGGEILESYPRSCVIDDQSFSEIVPEAVALEVVKQVLTVGPKTATCQGFQAVDQQCLMVNGEYFYEPIVGFKHEPGVTATIEVERRQICDPQVINSCPQDVSIYRYKLLNRLIQEGAAKSVDDKASVFVGEVIKITAEKDGFIVSLRSQYPQQRFNAVISPANLGQSSDFDFADIVLGNWLKVTGEALTLDKQLQMTVRTALSHTKIAIADKLATKQERNACLLAGGKIRKVGKLQADQCVLTYPDAGNSCSDSKQCFGQCLISDAQANVLAREAKVTGSCSTNNNSFGCKALIEDGHFNGVLCID